jgi:DNA helicase IV
MSGHRVYIETSRCEATLSKVRHDSELAAEREHIAFLYSKLDAERSPACAGTDNGLCFGRLEGKDGERSYVGRIGLFDDDDNRPLLTDWRAPAARPFYCATSAFPDGTRVRRHFRTRGRNVLDFHDDMLDQADMADDTVLLAALNAPRTEAMRDIVSTIQAEQDEIIRHPHNGALVIEGGPGTGKTVVALHRVAYLLYTQRERLSRRSVLIVGPNTGFLRHISQVLPSLGETDVVFVTTGDLVPGLHVTAQDTQAASRVKGSIAMVDVLTAAIADREELPAQPVAIALTDVTVWLDEEIAATARDRARVTRLRHNQARPAFRDAVLTTLAQRAMDRITAGWLRQGEAPGLRADLTEGVLAELAAHKGLRAALDELWPELSPQRLLADLFSSRQRIAVAAATLSETDRAALYRPDGDAWTVPDVPLLDEVTELLGDHDTGRASSRQTYEHVVVDEAQELSDLDWRVLARRCPSRSFTIVGDLAQRQSSAGARRWGAMLDRYVPGRWLHRVLTVNYRMPAEIMALAARVLADVDPAAQPPTSVRSTGFRPWALLVPEDELPAAVTDAIERETRLVGDGSVAVVAPEDLTLDVPTPVLTPRTAKGLEFDAVIVVQPQRIWSAPDSGAAQLYVTLTRATQRLGLLHTEPLPAGLPISGSQWRDD